MKFKTGALAICALLIAVGFTGTGVARSPPSFKKVFVIVLENTAAEKALEQPYLRSLLSSGAYLNQFYAVAHPSQPNYLAMTSGSTHDVAVSTPVDLAVAHLGDLLEVRNRTWREYAEGYPGNCFLGESHGLYVRKHAPFMSYANVQSNPARCANTVNATRLEVDIADGTLADYSLYIPDVRHDGHDTGVAFADKWLRKAFDAKLNDPRFMKDMLVVITFDEDDKQHDNHVYALLLGAGVRAGAQSERRYDHYSLLRTIEDRFTLGTLGKNDADASAISDVWK